MHYTSLLLPCVCMREVGLNDQFRPFVCQRHTPSCRQANKLANTQKDAKRVAYKQGNTQNDAKRVAYKQGNTQNDAKRVAYKQGNTQNDAKRVAYKQGNTQNEAHRAIGWPINKQTCRKMHIKPINKKTCREMQTELYVGQ